MARKRPPPPLRTYRLEQARIRTYRPYFEAFRAAVKELLTRVAPALDERADSLALDAPSDDARAAIAAFRANVSRLSNARRVLADIRLEAETDTRELYRQTTAQLDHLGVRVTRDPALSALVDLVTESTAAKIDGATDAAAARVADMVRRALVAGKHSKELAMELKEAFSNEWSTKRARLIARDQLGTAQAVVQHETFKAAGVTRAIWRTAKDARVRNEHVDLEGVEFEISEGVPVEGRPGEPINCRCYSEPVLDPG